MRAFIVLFVLLVVGAGGGGYWYYFTEQQRAADVKKLRDDAATLVAQGSFDGMTGGLEKLAKALERDKKNTRTFAAVAEASALRALLYGTPPDGVDQAIAAAARKITKPTQDGYRALVIARTALALARLTGAQADDANAATVEVLNKARLRSTSGSRSSSTTIAGRATWPASASSRPARATPPPTRSARPATAPTASRWPTPSAPTS